MVCKGVAIRQQDEERKEPPADQSKNRKRLVNLEVPAPVVGVMDLSFFTPAVSFCGEWVWLFDSLGGPQNERQLE